MTNHPKFTASHDSAARSVGYEGVREIRQIIDNLRPICIRRGKQQWQQ